MLQALTNPRLYKKALWALLILTIPSFVLLYGYGDTGGGGGGVNPVLVTTSDGRELTRDDINLHRSSLVNEYTQRYSMLTQQAPGARVAQQIESALSNADYGRHAVSEIAFEDLAREWGVAISPEQVARSLRRQGVTGEQLQAYLRQTGMREVDFVRSERARMRSAQAKSLVSSIARVSLLEVWQEYKLQNETLTAEVVSIDALGLASSMTVSDEEARGHFTANASEFIKPDERIYRYVVLDPPPVDRNPEVTEDEIRAEYDAANPAERPEFAELGGRRIRHIMLMPEGGATTGTLLVEAAELAGRARAGEDFATLANQNTDDLANADFAPSGDPVTLGGRLRTLVGPDSAALYRTTYGPVWFDTATAAPAGEVTEPFVSNGNVFVLKVEEIVPAGAKRPFEEVRTVARAAVRRAKIARAEQDQRQALNDLEFDLRTVAEEATSIEGVAQHFNTTVGVTSPTLATATVIQPVGDLGANAESLADLEVGIVGPAMRTVDNRLVVLVVSEELPERPYELAEVRSRVDQAIRQQKAEAEARRRAGEIREQVLAGAALADAAADAGYTVETHSTPFTRMQAPGALAQSQEFRLQSLRAGVGDVLVVSSGFGDFIFSIQVVRLTGKNEPAREQFLAEFQDFEAGLRFVKAQAFVDEFRRDAVAALNPQFDERFVSDSR
jgi:peptidyl-prolyl cis-trans isomerase D